MNETMQQWRDTLSDYYMQIGRLDSLSMLLLCAAIFMPLALIFPGNRAQPLFHKGMAANALYWFCAGPLIYAPMGKLIGNAVASLLILTGVYSLYTIHHVRDGLPPVADLPVVLQAFIILLVMDCIQYWTHRMFHTMKFWKFHAIHHSPVNVDWLTAVRFHPVNLIIHSTCVYAIVFFIGFSPEAWAVLAPFNAIYSPLVHANLNWTYGPFRYLLASPVFHRWHHTHINEGGNKNFAPTFPFLDILFGTYYDPRDARPTVFGTPHDPISENILDQLAYPFRKKTPKVTESITGDNYGQV